MTKALSATPITPFFESAPAAVEQAPNDSNCERATARAQGLLNAALIQQTRTEHAEAAKLGWLMGDPVGKAFTFAMVDEVFRSHNAATSARRWRGLISKFGMPGYPLLVDRMVMRLGAAGSRLLPGIVMDAVSGRMREGSTRVILPGEERALQRYLVSRATDGFRINLNLLGGAVLGEEEAERSSRTWLVRR